MRSPSGVLRLILVALVLGGGAGCSSTRIGRPKVAPGVRTITLVGDTPDSVVAGMPGASVGSGPLVVERPVGRDGRIHGRVVDERGRPIPGVEVRVADGSAAAGRDLSTVSDEAGGFTLRGLRPDETYTLVANRDGAKGGLYGRRRVVAPDGGVEIVLRGPDSASLARREKPTPRGEEFEPLPADQSARQRARVEEQRLLVDEPELDRALVRRATASEIDPWRSTSEARALTAQRIPLVDAPEEREGRSRSVMGMPYEDDEFNPLPPAREQPAPSRARGDDLPAGAELEPARPGDRGEAEPFTAGDGPLVPSFPEAEPLASERGEPSGPLDEFLPAPAGVGRMAGEADAPPRVPPPSEAPEGPLGPGDLSDFQPVEPEPTTGPPGARLPMEAPIDPPNQAEVNPTVPNVAPVAPDPSEAVPFESEVRPTRGFATRSATPRPRWNELTARTQARQEPSTIYPRSVRRLPREPVAPVVVAAEAGGRDPGVARATVRFDNRAKRIVDFSLADLDGRPVKFSELDSDYILLDFWGTWCAPCAKTMPHLVDLQERYDPSRLRVVGIAYERGPLPEQIASVRRMAREHGVNYPVLLGEQDGQPCPLLAALRVDQYPTLILLDRQGRILWRDSGSRAEMLDRLDRVIAANTRSTVNTQRR